MQSDDSADSWKNYCCKTFSHSQNARPQRPRPRRQRPKNHHDRGYIDSHTTTAHAQEVLPVRPPFSVTMRHQGKVAVITGGAAGIGAGLLRLVFFVVFLRRVRACTAVCNSRPAPSSAHLTACSLSALPSVSCERGFKGQPTVHRQH